jgi:hypothetical protein
VVCTSRHVPTTKTHDGRGEIGVSTESDTIRPRVENSREMSRGEGAGLGRRLREGKEGRKKKVRPSRWAAVEDGREVSKEAVGGRRQRQEGNKKREREKGAIRAAGPGGSGVVGVE